MGHPGNPDLKSFIFNPVGSPGPRPLFGLILRFPDFPNYVKLLLSNLEKLEILELKTLIRGLIPKAIIRLGDKEHNLELIYNLDVKASPCRKLGDLETFLHGNQGIVPMFSHPDYSDQITSEVGEQKWPYTDNGRADWI